MKQAQGGTLLGFIVGLLVGVVSALIVAVYVNKVPIPLMDRGVTRDRGNDAIEQERNKNWNPNAALSNKPAPVAPATAPSTDAPATPEPAKDSAKDEKSSSGDPLGDLIQTQTKGPGQVATVEAPNQPDPFIYFVQAGAFRNAADAEAQRARLAMLGFDAKVSEREQAGRPVFRVRLGPFDKQADADALQTRLNGQNVETALVRVQK